MSKFRFVALLFAMCAVALLCVSCLSDLSLDQSYEDAQKALYDYTGINLADHTKIQAETELTENGLTITLTGTIETFQYESILYEFNLNLGKQDTGFPTTVDNVTTNKWVSGDELTSLVYTSGDEPSIVIHCVR